MSFFHHVRRGLGWVVMGLACSQVYALTPTPAQLSMFNSLSASQKSEVMKALSGAGGGLPSSMGTSASQQDPLQMQDQMPALDMQQIATDKTAAEDKKFKPKDTLIVYFLDEKEAKDYDAGLLFSSLTSTATTTLQPQTEVANKWQERDKIQFVPMNKRQLYVLDNDGVVEIAPFGRIALAGLEETEAAARINAEVLLQSYYIRVKRLPVSPIGKDALKPFGYDLFYDQQKKDQTRLYSPSADIPIPSDYIIGPGDVVHVQLFGKDNQDLQLMVSRDGTLAFPGVGAIPVTGLSFDDLKTDLQRLVKKQFIGVSANITLGELRSIRVFVLGEVEKPGAHTITALSTMTYALAKASGVKEYGSLRNVQLKRNGKTISNLDVYDLLLKGDTSKDARLKPGDVVYVPSTAFRVSVVGQVRRPAIYELKTERSVKDVIQLAGGLLPEAYDQDVQIERIRDGKDRDIIDINLLNDAQAGTTLQDGDSLYIDAATDRKHKVVQLIGNVIRPGWFQWQPNMHLVDIIGSMDDIKPNSDLDYALIKRYLAPNYRLSVKSTSMRQAFADKNSESNLALQPRDEIIVFNAGDDRSLKIQPIIEQLLTQSELDKPSQVVRVGGQIRVPGSYPLEKEMRVSDLLRAGGRLKESAYTLEAELTRYVSERGAPREIEHIKVDLDKVLQGDKGADLLLQPYDHLNIKEIPSWQAQEIINIAGEVQFPGNYPIQRGETLSSVIKRAGGLSKFAYPEGAVFTREELRQREQERMDMMAANLEAELAGISLERSGDPTRVQSAGVANQLLSKLRNVKAAGRLVIDLNSAVNDPGGKYDIVLRDGDRIAIPGVMQEVTVIGEVFHPTSHIYQKRFDAADYIGLSGGTTRKADENSSYIIRANGSVVSAGIGWLSFSKQINPGDSVVVPLDAERIDTLRLWTSVSEIVYQLGVAAAAWNTLGVFK